MPTIKHGRSLARVDRIGAYIDSLQLNGHQIIMPSPDGRETHGGCAVLLPYANRVRNGVYTWNNKTYSLPRNDGLNSIHGLVRQEKWSYGDRDDIKDDTVELSFNLKRTGYPSTLDVLNRYEIGDNFMDISCNVTNSGNESCPLMVGFHPYFEFQETWKLAHSEKLSILEYRDSFFPSGKMDEVDYNSMKEMQGMNFDNCFFGGGDIRFVTKNFDLMIRRRNMEYLVIYNGKYSAGKSVAIEPMTGAPDAFNNQIGLIGLEPGDSFNCGFRIEIMDK